MEQNEVIDKGDEIMIVDNQESMDELKDLLSEEEHAYTEDFSLNLPSGGAISISEVKNRVLLDFFNYQVSMESSEQDENDEEFAGGDVEDVIIWFKKRGAKIVYQVPPSVHGIFKRFRAWIDLMTVKFNIYRMEKNESK